MKVLAPPITIATSITLQQMVTEYLTLQACHDKLITALKPDPLTIAGMLFRTGCEIHDKMLVPSFTRREKATSAIREKIEIAPQRFHQFMKLLTELMWTKDIAEILQSALPR